MRAYSGPESNQSGERHHCKGVRVAIAVATCFAWSAEKLGLVFWIAPAIDATSASWLMPLDEAIDEMLWPLLYALRMSLKVMPSAAAAPPNAG